MLDLNNTSNLDLNFDGDEEHSNFRMLGIGKPTAKQVRKKAKRKEKRHKKIAAIKHVSQRQKAKFQAVKRFVKGKAPVGSPAANQEEQYANDESETQTAQSAEDSLIPVDRGSCTGEECPQVEVPQSEDVAQQPEEGNEVGVLQGAESEEYNNEFLGLKQLDPDSEGKIIGMPKMVFYGLSLIAAAGLAYVGYVKFIKK